MPHPGDLLGDRYRLDDRIAAGGMGEVWQATDTVLGRDVAVKTLRASSAADTGFRTRFRNEARAMAVLHHPGVADVYDYGQNGSDAYIVMAHVHGEPLNQRLAERGKLTPAETMSVVAQAARALEAAHEAGIVHRDVKPGNLIIQPDGTVVLVDFGVAHAADSPTLTPAREIVGTALYIAPEQLSKHPAGPAADIYALGAVAYHCLAGRPPFVGPSAVTVALMHLHDTPAPLPGEIPAEVRDLVTRAMAKDPADRFPSAAALAEAADEALVDTAPDHLSLTRTLAMAAVIGEADPDATRPMTIAPAAPGPPGGGRRKRVLILSALAALIVGTATALLTLVDPDGPGGTPAPAQSASVKPSTVRSPTKAGGGGEPTKATRRPSARTSEPGGPAATPSRSPTTDPAPSRTPTAEPPTTEPAETGTATAPASGDDDQGGDDQGGDG